MPGMPSGSESRACLASRSASDTTPITFPLSSRTGKALTRCARRALAMARNDASFLTETTRVVITSLTVDSIVSAFLSFAVPQRLSTTLSAPVSAARLKTS